MKKRLIVLLGFVLLAAFFGLGLHRYLTLEALKHGQATFAAWYGQRPLPVVGAYFLLYVAVAALSLPGAGVMTLAGGALFGLWTGTLVVSFASSIGATLAFLVARFLLRDSVQRRFGGRLAAVNRGVEKDGAFYLFALRLVPVFPFFVINLVMALTPIRTFPFYWVSQLGMLAGTVVYVNAGTRLAEIESPAGILSPGIIFSFALLGIFPVVARKFIATLKKRRLYGGHSRPRRFDRNLVVIGAGAAGLVTSYIAATLKAKVTLIEKNRMGGDCLNTGCVPSKALIRTARFLRQVRGAAELGVEGARATVDFGRVMARVQASIRKVAPHDSVERYTALGVEVLQGTARIVSPWTVEITGADGGRQTLSTRAVVIASGASPVIPAIAGIDSVRHFTSDSIWSLTELPRRLVVLGGGPIGCELSQAFAHLGCRVTMVLRGPRLLPREDDDAAVLLSGALVADGVRIMTNTASLRCETVAGEERLLVRQGGQEEEALPFDALLCATGRRPRTTGFGLEELGLPLAENGSVETDEYLQTLYPNIYACGDVAGPYQFTHAAAHQAWYAAVNALFGGIKRFRVDYRVIPWVTFTSPEIARVGLSEAEARRAGIACEVTRYGLEDLDRAITDSAARGFVKVLTRPGRDEILGVLIAGEQAGEMLAEFTLAMRHGIGLSKILDTIHPYPTWSEAARYAAGQWKRDHAPRWIFPWLARFHAWRRGGSSSA